MQVKIFFLGGERLNWKYLHQGESNSVTLRIHSSEDMVADWLRWYALGRKKCGKNWHSLKKCHLVFAPLSSFIQLVREITRSQANVKCKIRCLYCEAANALISAAYPHFCGFEMHVALSMSQESFFARLCSYMPKVSLVLIKKLHMQIYQNGKRTHYTLEKR